jgi:polygalacturonase
MTTSRNLSNRGKDFVSVKDFGATGDGSTDDTLAVQAAITYAVIVSANTVYFPAGFSRDWRWFHGHVSAR